LQEAPPGGPEFQQNPTNPPDNHPPRISASQDRSRQPAHSGQKYKFKMQSGNARKEQLIELIEFSGGLDQKWMKYALGMD